MKFSNNIVGPEFNRADLVCFDFGNAEISLRLPPQPGSAPSYIAKSDQTDFNDKSGRPWATHPLGFRIKQLIFHSWDYCDETSENTVAKENLMLYLVDIPEDIKPEISPLCKQKFNEWLFYFVRFIAVNGETSLLGSEEEQRGIKAAKLPRSREEIQQYSAGTMEWPIITLGDSDESYADLEPDHFIYIPISSSSFLYIDHTLSIMCSEDSPLRPPKRDIMPLKREILKEILDHIRVTYSSEIEELIAASN